MLYLTQYYTVRVAGMDYFVPDKIPQPKNVLESLVWDREKDIERLKERFPQQRALLQAKVAEGKFPKRSLVDAVLTSQKSGEPALILLSSRSSLHNGRSSFAIHAPSGTIFCF